MTDQPRTKQELLEEISVLKQKNKELEELKSGRDLVEEALRESEKELRWLFKSMINAFVLFESVFDNDSKFVSYRFVYINDAYERITGVKNKEVKGKTVHEVWPETEPEWIKRYGEVAVTGASQSFELYHDPTKKLYLCNVYRPWNTKDRFCVIFEDITKRKKAEEALRESELKYRSLIECSSDAVFCVDEKGQYKFTNHLFASTFGKTPDYFIGKTFWDIYPKEHADQRYAVTKRVFQTGESESVEVEVPLPDKTLYFYATANPIKDETGKVIQILTHATNITARKLAEEELKKSEEKYRTIIENMEEGYHEVDLKGNFTFFNESMLNILGYEREDLLGMNNRQYADEENTRKVYQVYNQVYRTGEPVKNFEWQIIRKDGDRRDIEVSISLIRNTEGQPTGFRGILRDTTERKQAEDQLREERQRLTGIIKGTNVGTWEWNVQTGETIFNDRWAEIIGYTLEEISPISIETWMKYAHPDDLKASGDLLEKHFRGEIDYYEFESRMKHKDGNWICVLDRGKVVTWSEDAKPLMMMGTHQDINERKQMDEELRQEKTFAESIVNTAQTIILVLDTKGCIVSINPYMENISGYQLKEVQGKDWFSIFLPEPARNFTKELFLKAIADIQTHGNVTSIITKDGRVIDIEWYDKTLKDESGNIMGLLSIGQDITERIQVEEEKRSLEERLQRAEKMESLGLLAGGVAHDLNNVLGIVVGYAELLLLKESKSNTNRPLLDEIMKGGQKAAAIVEDLLTLARRGVPGSNILNLNSIISDFQKSPEFKQLSSFNSSIQIKTELEPDLPNISGSSVHLGKTIFNLVSNASEAMKKGGFVTIKTANQYLDKPIREYDEIREGDYVVLSVSDTGEGIPDADLKRIFEPFYTKKVMGRSGTGLGLAVVWGTVKDHNGYINVQSEEGKGSTFTLYFPVTREELSAEHIAVSISEYMGKGESILIVDDVKGQRALATLMLKELNYSVASVSSGEEAVAYLKEHKADLMVLDMIMDPGMDGLDTYRSVLEIRSKQKAIIVSGFSESDRVKAARVLGAGAYVKKPYVIEKLGLAVRKELDRVT